MWLGCVLTPIALSEEEEDEDDEDDEEEEEDEAAAEAKRAAALRVELWGMKLRALQRRAEELGVAEAELDEAEEKAEVIALILAALEEEEGEEEGVADVEVVWGTGKGEL